MIQWIIKKLQQRRESSLLPVNGVTLATREKGIIQYEVELLPDSEVIHQWPEQFLSSELRWYWDSAYGLGAKEYENHAHFPSERPLTVLTQANKQDLLFDLHDIDEDFNRRDMMIFGTDWTCEPVLLNPAGMQVALNNFIEREEGPIQVVISQVHDFGSIAISVPHKPIEVVEMLLKSWGIDESTVAEVRRYNKNDAYTLEGYVRATFKNQRQ